MTRHAEVDAAWQPAPLQRGSCFLHRLLGSAADNIVAMVEATSRGY
jgi:hypothetical protein